MDSQNTEFGHKSKSQYQNPHQIPINTNKDFHPISHSQFLNFSAYHNQFTPHRIQFENKMQKPKQYWSTWNFSTPNLELLIKIERRMTRDSQLPSCFTPCTPKTQLTLSISCSSLYQFTTLPKPFPSPKIWLL